MNQNQDNKTFMRLCVGFGIFLITFAVCLRSLSASDLDVENVKIVALVGYSVYMFVGSLILPGFVIVRNENLKTFVENSMKNAYYVQKSSLRC